MKWHYERTMIFHALPGSYEWSHVYSEAVYKVFLSFTATPLLINSINAAVRLSIRKILKSSKFSYDCENLYDFQGFDLLFC